MVVNINNEIHHFVHRFQTYSTYAYSQISNICSKAMELTYNFYDFIYHRNPLTNVREIQTLPLMFFSNFFPCECSFTAKEANSYLNRLVQKIGSNIEKVSTRKNLKFTISPDISTTWTCHKGDVKISQNELLALETLWLGRSSKYRDVTYEDLVANHIAHEVAHFNGLHASKKVEKRILFHVTAVKVFHLGLKFLNLSILPSLLLLNMFFIVTMEGLLKHKISYYSLSLLVVGIVTNLLLLGFTHAGIAFALCFGLSFASGLVSDTLDQSCELKADQYAMHYLLKAGYNPRAMLCFAASKINPQISWWEKIKNIIFHTFGLMNNHPSFEKRLENGQKTLIELKLPNTRRYHSLKHRVQSIYFIEKMFHTSVATQK